jgi:hypothetical protein
MSNSQEQKEKDEITEESSETITESKSFSTEIDQKSSTEIDEISGFQNLEEKKKNIYFNTKYFQEFIESSIERSIDIEEIKLENIFNEEEIENQYDEENISLYFENLRKFMNEELKIIKKNKEVKYMNDFKPKYKKDYVEINNSDLLKDDRMKFEFEIKNFEKEFQLEDLFINIFLYDMEKRIRISEKHQLKGTNIKKLFTVREANPNIVMLVELNKNFQLKEFDKMQQQYLNFNSIKNKNEEAIKNLKENIIKETKGFEGYQQPLLYCFIKIFSLTDKKEVSLIETKEDIIKDFYFIDYSIYQKSEKVINYFTKKIFNNYTLTYSIKKTENLIFNKNINSELTLELFTNQNIFYKNIEQKIYIYPKLINFLKSKINISKPFNLLLEVSLENLENNKKLKSIFFDNKYIEVKKNINYYYLLFIILLIFYIIINLLYY